MSHFKRSQRKYSNHAIETAVTLCMVFGLASRQTEGYEALDNHRAHYSPRYPLKCYRHGHITAVPFSRADWLDETALIHNQVEHGENDSSRRDISNKALGKSMRAKRALTQPRVQ